MDDREILRRARRPLSPPGRQKRIFFNMLIAHGLALFLPLAILWLDGVFGSEEPEPEFTVNLVDDPSVGPKVGPVTTRLPPADDPTPDAAPEPIPEPPTPEPVPPDPAPPAPEPPSEPTVKAPQPRPAPPKEPKIKTPKPPKPAAPKPKPKPKPAAPKPQDRKLPQNTRNTRKTGNNTNEFVPIGPEEFAQRYGPKASNTPQGGPNKAADYGRQLVAFLKMQWKPPSRAELGDRKPEVVISLAVAADGKVLEGRIVQTSGVPAMDAAARRMLENLRQVPKPPDGAVRIDRIILDTEE